MDEPSGDDRIGDVQMGRDKWCPLFKGRFSVIGNVISARDRANQHCFFSKRASSIVVLAGSPKIADEHFGNLSEINRSFF